MHNWLDYLNELQHVEPSILRLFYEKILNNSAWFLMARIASFNCDVIVEATEKGKKCHITECQLNWWRRKRVKVKLKGFELSVFRNLSQFHPLLSFHLVIWELLNSSEQRNLEERIGRNVCMHGLHALILFLPLLTICSVRSIGRKKSKESEWVSGWEGTTPVGSCWILNKMLHFSSPVPLLSF